MSAKQTPSLDGLIQTKGAARPDTMPQRGASEEPTSKQVIASAAPEPRAKSLTLRLSESQYQRLRRFAFDRGLSHQDVIEAALMAHISRHLD